MNETNRKWTLLRVIVDERGAVLALVAITLPLLLAAMALAIDLGMLFTARAEAQRAADAAALAGAQEFLKAPPAEAEGPARRYAYEFAGRNKIRNVSIDSSEVSVEVFSAQRVVRVTISRRAVPTWFARIFGVTSVPIGAVAAAEASPAGSVKCVKPFAVPDLWDDRNNDGKYEPGIDVYQPHGDDFGPCVSPDGTGYGSCLRGSDRDYGRQIEIKVTNPNDPNQIVSGYFFPVRLEWDASSGGDCATGGGSQQGARTYMNNICSCNARSIRIGDTLRVETGNMVGPTFDGIDKLVNQDPGASWDESSRRVVGSKLGDQWLDSPRVAKIALFAPDQILSSRDKFLVATNFALIFLETQDNRRNAVTGRFLYFARGDQTTSRVTGSLVRTLRLIE